MSDWIEMSETVAEQILSAAVSGLAVCKVRGFEEEGADEPFFAPVITHAGVQWVYNPEHDFGFAQHAAKAIQLELASGSYDLAPSDWFSRPVKKVARRKLV